MTKKDRTRRGDTLLLYTRAKKEGGGKAGTQRGGGGDCGTAAVYTTGGREGLRRYRSLRNLREGGGGEEGGGDCGTAAVYTTKRKGGAAEVPQPTGPEGRGGEAGKKAEGGKTKRRKERTEAISPRLSSPHRPSA